VSARRFSGRVKVVVPAFAGTTWRASSGLRESHDTFPIEPKSTTKESPDWIGRDGWQVPVVTTSPALSVLLNLVPARQLAAQRARSGSDLVPVEHPG